MNVREKYSVVLVSLGLILALLPLTGNRSFTVKPNDLITEVSNTESVFTVDQVARFVVSEDSTIQLIDLRTPEEFRAFNIPGAINLPYNDFLNSDPATLFGNQNLKNIFYSNGDFDSNYALMAAKGMKYNNVYIMKGGLNEWFNTVMNSTFTGEKISARENALFETRTRARRLFTEINSLPDSLKQKFYDSKHMEAKKLDGGCE
ncbi:MAG: rhodanese-like domain-containing protein [Bacteroidales bacterium]|nr:rhodanese-like domain-containing protein [Bacteroidales bacterium]